MKNLRKNINKFYKKYDIANYQTSKRVSKADIYDYNVLMDVYNDIYDNLVYYEDKQDVDNKWVCDLYTSVNNQMFAIENDLILNPNNNKAIAIFKLCVSIFCTLSVGAFVAIMIEYGFDIMCSLGILVGSFLTTCSFIGYKEDIKCL